MGPIFDENRNFHYLRKFVYVGLYYTKVKEIVSRVEE